MKTFNFFDTKYLFLLFFIQLGISSNAAVISGQVWIDINNNGIKEPLETLITNETVELYSTVFGFQTNTTTDSNGQYSFDNLGTGTYYVKISTTFNNLTQYNVGNDDSIDNDFSCLGTTVNIFVSDVFDATDVDAGLGNGLCSYCYNGAPFFSCPADVTLQDCTVDANDFSLTGEPIFYSNCNVSIQYIDEFIPNCPPEIERYFYIIDMDGNFYSCVQNITFAADNISPVMTCPSTLLLEVTQSCDIFTTIIGPTAVDNCSNFVPITYEINDISGNILESGIGSTINTEFTIGTYVINWTATDDCGNQSFCTQNIYVIDQIAPNIIATNLTFLLSPFEPTTILADDFNIATTDNCGPFTLWLQCPSLGSTQTDTLPPTAGASCTFHCSELEDIEVDLWAIDQSGNASYVTVTLSKVSNGDCCPEDHYFYNPVPNATYQVWDQIDASNKIETTQNVTYDAANYIQLNPSFEVALGADFEAKIGGCTISPKPETINSQ